MKRTLQKLCSTLLALIMLVGVVPSGILTVRAESAPLQSPYWDFTDMTKETLLKDWSIRNEDPDTWELNSNGLTFGACSGDLSWAATYQNMFQTALMGDCIADVRVTLSSYWKQQDAGFNFAIWQDDSNFIKLAYQNVFTGRIWLEAFSGGVQKETATSGDHNQSYTATDVYFRVRKVSNTYSFYYSSDGDDYTKIGNDLTYAFSDPKIVSRNFC